MSSGWINTFLSWGGFVPLSRLSYIIYLTHMTIITVVYGGVSQAPIAVSNTVAVSNYLLFKLI